MTIVEFHVLYIYSCSTYCTLEYILVLFFHFASSSYSFLHFYFMIRFSGDKIEIYIYLNDEREQTTDFTTNNQIFQR